MGPRQQAGGAGRPFAVVDIDGVVADVRHRLPHLARRPKDWAGFFAGIPLDPVLDVGREACLTLAEGCELVWLTGRPETFRRPTLDWLARHDLPEGRLLMRRALDRRPARAVKVEALRALARERPVAVHVDDDPAVVRAVRAAGFQALHADWMPVEEHVEEQGAEHSLVHRRPRQGDLFEAQEREGRT